MINRLYNQLLLKPLQTSFLRFPQGVVQQGNLILNPNKGNPKLKDLYIRPSITQRRSPVSVTFISTQFIIKWLCIESLVEPTLSGNRSIYDDHEIFPALHELISFLHVS